MSEATAKHPITRYREQNGLSQDDFAKLAGVSVPTVSRWEARKREPRGDDLRKLCALLSCSSDQLLGVEAATQ